MENTGSGDQKVFFSKTANLKVLALDCDGVLFDSREANIQFYSHIMARVGRPPVRPDQHEYIHMYPVRQSLAYLLGSDGEEFCRAYEYFKTIDFGPFNNYLQREPGLVPFLEEAQKHFRTALATNRTSSTLELLRQYELRGYFDLVVCASDVDNPKPHPDIMNRILEYFGVPPREVLYVGDSKVDEIVASATGVLFAAYKNPALAADIHISHFEELYPLFQNGPQACD